MKVSRKLLVFFSICALSFAAFSTPGEVLSAPKGTLVIAQGGDLATLDPQMMGDNYTRAAVRFPYDELVKRIYKDGRIQHFPLLATSWEAVNDTTWIIHLRKGVKFHNGYDFTAEDVKFTMERMLDPAKKARCRFYFTFVERVEVVDPYTVKISTKGPAPLLIKNLAYTLSMFSAKYFKEKGDAYAARHPMGTGPFKFVRWVKDDEVVFEANENYWAGPPKIKTLIIKPIPEDSTRVAALLGGDADIVKKIPPHLIPMINKSGKAKVLKVPSALGITVWMNTLKKGPLQDKRVRQAINYGVDKESIMETVLEGYAKPLATPLSPAIFGHNPNLKPYPYDPEKAKALLKEAGYGDGITVTFGTCSGRYPKDKEFAEAIAGQLGKVGVNVKVRVYEWGGYISGWYAGTLGDLYTIGQAASFDADPIYWKMLHCSDRAPSLWCNKEFDRLLEKGRVTMDEKKREKLYWKAEELVHEEAPALFWMHGVDTYGVSNRVQNWSPTPDEATSIYVYQASVKD
jgi:peptide/nickel transport system substrate-binding protein